MRRHICRFMQNFEIFFWSLERKVYFYLKEGKMQGGKMDFHRFFVIAILPELC